MSGRFEMVNGVMVAKPRPTMQLVMDTVVATCSDFDALNTLRLQLERLGHEFVGIAPVRT